MAVQNLLPKAADVVRLDVSEQIMGNLSDSGW